MNPLDKTMRGRLPPLPFIFPFITYYFNPNSFIPKKFPKNRQSDSTIAVLIPRY
jgi:hypothetical protein